MSDKEIREALEQIKDADVSIANYHLLEHEQKKALARIENKAPEWLKAQQQLIDSQAKEIERLSAIVTRYEDTLTEEGYDIRFMIAEVEAHLIALAEGS